MTERLLQFIWQFQYFNKNELATTRGEPICVVSPGSFNCNQGPDFMQAKIRIGIMEWTGTVELHINRSDWQKHRHQFDSNYRNVILHVVWNDDEGIEATALPVLELRSRVPKVLLQRYEDLMNSPTFIPCEKSIHKVKEITWQSWKERMLAERLLRKAGTVDEYLEQNHHHWEEAFWWLLARNFGTKVNADAFEAIARSLSLKLLANYKNRLYRLEALLLGQGGLLNKNFTDEYPLLLKKEYLFQQKKYGLRPIPVPLHFLRMRPGNFPTVRLAQLAMLVYHAAHLFSKIREAATVDDIRRLLGVSADAYWNNHYRLDELAGYKEKKLGADMINNVIINTVIPVLFAYGHQRREDQYKTRAVQWLEEIAPEVNAIIKGFLQAGIKSRNAFDTQALIELKNEYCNKKRCLDCAIGNFLLKEQEGRKF